MNLTELDNFNLGDAVYFHDKLNPALYDGDRLKEDVRKQLLVIAEDFVDHLGIKDLDIEDITISGSNAAYSYTRHSDIDLHILINMETFKNDDVYRELFNAKKTVYNDSHDIIINGYEVELYVQDVNEPVISLGEYSLVKDSWIKLPRKRRAHVDQAATKVKYKKLFKLSEYAIKTNNAEKIKNVLRTLKKYRQAGLDFNGEFGPENLAYKILRSKGIIKQLYEKLQDLHDKRLSLPESKLLNKPEMSIAELAKKHSVDKTHIMDQLIKGLAIEAEHTSDEKAAREIALDHLAEDPNYYTKLEKANLEECSGYIPSEKEKNDPRWERALSVDVKPDTMKVSAKKLGWNIRRDGVPPTLKP